MRHGNVLDPRLQGVNRTVKRATRGGCVWSQVVRGIEQLTPRLIPSLKHGGQFLQRGPAFREVFGTRSFEG